MEEIVIKTERDVKERFVYTCGDVDEVYEYFRDRLRGFFQREYIRYSGMPLKNRILLKERREKREALSKIGFDPDGLKIKTGVEKAVESFERDEEFRKKASEVIVEKLRVYAGSDGKRSFVDTIFLGLSKSRKVSPEKVVEEILDSEELEESDAVAEILVNVFRNSLGKTRYLTEDNPCGFYSRKEDEIVVVRAYEGIVVHEVAHGLIQKKYGHVPAEIDEAIACFVQEYVTGKRVEDYGGKIEKWRGEYGDFEERSFYKALFLLRSSGVKEKNIERLVEKCYERLFYSG